MRAAALSALLLLALQATGCGYHRLDRRPRAAAWMVKG